MLGSPMDEGDVRYADGGVGKSGPAGVAQGDASGAGLEKRVCRSGFQTKDMPVERPSFWSDVEWIPCRDGKARPAKPGIFPLAAGVPARVGKLRAAGNAIVPQVAEAFIRSYLDCEIFR